MKSLLNSIVTFLLFSCTIIDDNAVSSRDDLNKLRVTNIKFTQVSSNGNITKWITPVDSALNITFSLGKLTKQTKIPWGNVESNSKFRFRSGSTSNIMIRNWYFENGDLRSSFVFSNNKAVELYYFNYKSKGLIKTIITIIYPDPNDLSKVNRTYDSILYDPQGSYFGFAYRFSPDVNRRAIFTIDNPLTDNPCPFKWVYKRSIYVPSSQDKEYGWCSNSNFYIYPGGQTASFFVTGDDLVEDVFIADNFSDSDKKCCADKYYYHPILFMPVNIRYKIMLAPDWWEEISPTVNTQNEYVNFKFSYGD